MANINITELDLGTIYNANEGLDTYSALVFKKESHVRVRVYIGREGSAFSFTNIELTYEQANILHSLLGFVTQKIAENEGKER